jgi:hypothetical protein
MQASPRRILFLNTCWKSIDRVNLSRLGKDSLIRPWLGGLGLHYDHREFAYAHETRAFWHVLNYWVGMYVSSQTPRLTICRFQQGATMYW